MKANYEALPLCLRVKDVAEVMGISLPMAYDMVNREDFPKMRIGAKRQRIVIPRDRFLKWLLKDDYAEIMKEPQVATMTVLPGTN